MWGPNKLTYLYICTSSTIPNLLLSSSYKGFAGNGGGTKADWGVYYFFLCGTTVTLAIDIVYSIFFSHFADFTQESLFALYGLTKFSFPVPLICSVIVLDGLPYFMFLFIDFFTFIFC